MAEQKSVGSIPHTSPAANWPRGNCKVGRCLTSVNGRQRRVVEGRRSRQRRRLLVRDNHAELAAFIAGAVGEEAIVVAPRAEWADRDVFDA